MSESSNIFAEIKNIVSEMDVLNTKWLEKGTKSAAMRMRKLSSIIDKKCKEFRKASVIECKKTD